jgi:hypothetical protein
LIISAPIIEHSFSYPAFNLSWIAILQDNETLEIAFMYFGPGPQDSPVWIFSLDDYTTMRL